MAKKRIHNPDSGEKARQNKKGISLSQSSGSSLEPSGSSSQRRLPSTGNYFQINIKS